MTNLDPQPYKEHDTGVRWASPVETNDGTGWVKSVFDPRPEYEQDESKYL